MRRRPPTPSIVTERASLFPPRSSSFWIRVAAGALGLARHPYGSAHGQVVSSRKHKSHQESHWAQNQDLISAILSMDLTLLSVLSTIHAGRDLRTAEGHTSCKTDTSCKDSE